MMLDCPECDAEMKGGEFGDPAACLACRKVWETDWDYLDAYEGSITSWTTGEITGCQRQEVLDAHDAAQHTQKGR